MKSEHWGWKNKTNKTNKKTKLMPVILALGGSGVQGHPQLNIKFKASLGYLRSCLKIKTNKQIKNERPLPCSRILAVTPRHLETSWLSTFPAHVRSASPRRGHWEMVPMWSALGDAMQSHWFLPVPGAQPNSCPSGSVFQALGDKDHTGFHIPTAKAKLKTVFSSFKNKTNRRRWRV